MPASCPNCHSRFLHISRPRNLKERWGRLRFVLPLRCGDCKTRFVANTFALQDLKWARCPHCLRTDLASWSLSKSPAESFWTKLRISWGANLWRCEYCRRNFTSFRPRQEAFSFHRWRRMNEEQNERRKTDEK